MGKKILCVLFVFVSSCAWCATSDDFFSIDDQQLIAAVLDELSDEEISCLETLFEKNKACSHEHLVLSLIGILVALACGCLCLLGVAACAIYCELRSGRDPREFFCPRRESIFIEVDENYRLVRS